MLVVDDFPFTSRFFTLRSGFRQHYVDEGQGDTLVFLHGNPTWSYYWRNLLVNLRERFRVISIDHLGCGLSDKPQGFDYCLKNHIENVTEILHALKIDKMTLLLHDWGGAIGMGYAKNQPSTIARMALFNTAAFTSNEMPYRIALGRVPGVGKALIQGLNAFVLGTTWMATTKGLSRQVRANYLLPYRTYRDRIATYRFVKDIPMGPKHPSWQTLREIENSLNGFQRVPVGLFWGGRDWVFHQGFLRAWKDRFPNAYSHLYENAGHLVVEDAFPQVYHDLGDFLERTAH